MISNRREILQKNISSSYLTKKEVILFIRYAVVSASALLIDLITYKYLSAQNLFSIPTNAALSYTVGLFWAYLVFILGIFKNGKLRKQPIREFTMFTMSGVVGVMISFAVTWVLSTTLLMNAWGAKLVAVAISFISVFAFRRKYVF